MRLPRVTAEAPWLQNSLEDTAGSLEVMPAAVQEAGEEAHAYSSSMVRLPPTAHPETQFPFSDSPPCTEIPAEPLILCRDCRGQSDCAQVR